MSASVCGTTIPHRKITCIEDAIGHDGIDAYVERSLALGRHVVGKPDVEGARRFASLFVGSYERGTGRQTHAELRKIFLPTGFLHVEIHDADSSESVKSIYGDGERHMVTARDVAFAIACMKPVFKDGIVSQVTYRESDLPAVLELVVRVTAPLVLANRSR